MMKVISTVAAAGFMLAGMTFAADAMPAAPVAPQQNPGLTLIAGGCGPGWHRGPYGGCRRNWGWGPRPWRHCWWRHTPWGPRRICRW